MEFYEAKNNRRTTREFLDKEVDFETIKRTVFKCKELKSSYVSNLNPFATIWCVVENIFLAATSEGLQCSMRIPLNEEHDIVKQKLKVPPIYMMPAFIGIGYADPKERKLEQQSVDMDKQLRFGRWK